MGYKDIVMALGMVIAAPLSAAQPEPAPPGGAPVADPDARYCLRVEPATGSRIETVRCETRAMWAELEVDVDKEWAREGVAVVTSRG